MPIFTNKTNATANLVLLPTNRTINEKNIKSITPSRQNIASGSSVEIDDADATTAVALWVDPENPATKVFDATTNKKIDVDHTKKQLLLGFGVGSAAVLALFKLASLFSSRKPPKSLSSESSTKDSLAVLPSSDKTTEAAPIFKINFGKPKKNSKLDKFKRYFNTLRVYQIVDDIAQLQSDIANLKTQVNEFEKSDKTHDKQIAQFAEFLKKVKIDQTKYIDWFKEHKHPSKPISIERAFIDLSC